MTRSKLTRCVTIGATMFALTGAGLVVLFNASANAATPAESFGNVEACFFPTTNPDGSTTFTFEFFEE